MFFLSTDLTSLSRSASASEAAFDGDYMEEWSVDETVECAVGQM